MKKSFITLFAALSLALALPSCGDSKAGQEFLQQYEAIIVQAEEAQQSGEYDLLEELKQQADELIEANSETNLTSEQEEKFTELLNRMVMVDLNAAWDSSDDDDDDIDDDDEGEDIF